MLVANAEVLLYWIKERYAILEKKRAGEPAPWSVDPVMQTCYFTNVHRENDKVTQWLRDKWGKHANHHNYTLAIVMARFVNKIDSLEAIGFPKKWDEQRFIQTMEALDKPWGGAYIVSTNGRPMGKARYIGQMLTQHLLRMQRTRPAMALAFESLESTHTYLKEFNGLGDFMAAQVVADLKNTKGHPLEEALDWWKWCVGGPGSLKGMAWIQGREKIKPREFIALMPTLDTWISERLPSNIPALCAQDLQNCLCELSKYVRVKNGTGRSKRGYNGKGC